MLRIARSSPVMVAILAWLIIALPVLAAFTASITVVQTGGIAYTMLAANVTANVDYMANNGYFGNTGLDTRVVEGLSSIPHMLVDDRIMFATPVPVDSSKTLQFTTGSSNLTAFNIIVGFGGSVSIGDNASLEPSDNFSHQLTGWVNTDNATGKWLVRKNFAYRIYVSENVSGNITADILTAGSPTTETLRPNAPGDACVIPNETGAACPNHYLNVDEAVADDGTTLVGIVNDTSRSTDWYNLADTALSVTDNITSVALSTRGTTTAAASGLFFRGDLRLGGNTINGTERDPGGSTWTTFSESFNRPGGGTWQFSDLDDVQVGATIQGQAGDSAFITQMFVVVSYIPHNQDKVVTAIGVASGEYSILVTANVTTFAIAIDEVEQDSVALSGSSVPDNGQDWTIMAGNSAAYLESVSMNVSGVQALLLEPNDIISGTTLPDRAGTSQNGAITFGTNPSSVNITLGGLVSDFTVEGVTGLEQPDIVPVLTPPISPSDAAILVALADDPLIAVAETIEDQTGIPVLLQYWMGYLVIALLGFGLVYKFLPNLLLSMAVFCGVIGFAVAQGVYPFWIVAILVLLLGGAGILEGRQPT